MKRFKIIEYKNIQVLIGWKFKKKSGYKLYYRMFINDTECIYNKFFKDLESCLNAFNNIKEKDILEFIEDNLAILEYK